MLRLRIIRICGSLISAFRMETVLDLYRELTAVRKVPAVFLTARDEERDMLQAFDMGAEDYVVKPFSMKVLLKRIERILKTNREGRMLTCGGITLYPEKKQVLSGDEEIALTAKEYQLLELFYGESGSGADKGKYPGPDLGD